MGTERYELPTEGSWSVPASFDSIFSWDYEDRRERLLTLYGKGKQRQWDAAERIDWSIEVDPRSPENVPDVYIPIYGSDMWERLTEKERATLRHHMFSWLNSQFLHGEQGGLLAAAKIVQCIPDIDAKYYASTQVIDEARHVEIFDRYLREKVEMIYPVNASLKKLLENVMADSRWDMTYLGMQVLIEGLALAAFSLFRDFSKEPLSRALNAYVVQDEARHVAFGRLALRDYYPQLTSAEKAEREEYVVEACWLMRDRFTAAEVWENLGFDLGAVLEHVETSNIMRQFRKVLFSRIVPVVKDIGLFGPKAQRCFEELGVIEFAKVDADKLAIADEKIAREIERKWRREPVGTGAS